MSLAPSLEGGHTVASKSAASGLFSSGRLQPSGDGARAARGSTGASKRDGATSVPRSSRSAAAGSSNSISGRPHRATVPCLESLAESAIAGLRSSDTVVLAHTVDLWSLARDRCGRGFRMASSDRDDRCVRRRNAEFRLGFGQTEPRASKADAVGPETHSPCREHQVLRGEAAILGGLRRIGCSGDNNQQRCAVKDVECWVGELVAIPEVRRTVLHGVEKILLGSICVSCSDCEAN